MRSFKHLAPFTYKQNIPSRIYKQKETFQKSQTVNMYSYDLFRSVENYYLWSNYSFTSEHKCSPAEQGLSRRKITTGSNNI